MEIKKTLDNMPRLIFWRVDDAVILILPFMLGVLFGSLWLVFGSCVCVVVYRKLRKQNEELNLKALSYWILGAGFSSIPSYIRRFRR